MRMGSALYYDSRERKYVGRVWPHGTFPILYMCGNMPRKVAKKTTARRKGTTPPFEPHPDWTEARFFAFLRSALRAAWSRWPPKYKVLAEAKRKSESSNKRLKWEFQCNECKAWFPQKQVSVDHMVPAGTLRRFEDLPDFCRNLFVGTESLQVLCDECHSRKSLAERQSTKNNNKENNND